MISDTNKNRLLMTACLAAIPISLIYCFDSGEWSWLIISVVLYQIYKLFSSTIAVHRYFSHRSFKTGPLRHKFLAFITIPLAVKSPISWVMNHRHHHKFSDQENDTHSPHNNLLETTFGLWEYHGYEWFKNKGVAFHVRDLLRDPTIMWIDRNYWRIWTIALIVTAIIDWRITLFCLLLPAGYFRITVNLVINTIGHWKLPGSYRNFETNDRSQNHWLFGVFSMGDGFHNNHHQNQSSYTTQVKWYEFDIAGWMIKWFFKTDKNPA